MSLHVVIEHLRRERDAAQGRLLDAERHAQATQRAWRAAAQRRKSPSERQAGSTTSVGALQAVQDARQACAQRCQKLQAAAEQAVLEASATRSRLLQCEQRLQSLERLARRRQQAIASDRQRRAKRDWAELLISAVSGSS